MRYVKLFEEFISESVGFYSVDSDTEKRAGISSNKIYRYASKDALISKMKKYYFKPNILTAISDDRVSLKPNSKSSFKILTKTKFKEGSEKLLYDTLDRVKNIEGHHNYKITFLKPNEIFIEFDFINEAAQSTDSGLKKIYLATRRDSGQRWWSYKGFAGDKFFIQITENNIDKIDINPDYPILNYHSSIIEQLLKEGRIKEENIYNHPKWIPLSGSKKEFHKLVGEDENVPKTVYSKNEALKKLTFPIIAKPANGHSGIGIQVIKNPDLMEDLDDSIFDTFSEYVDKAEEMRFFTFKGEPIFWMERTPVNAKAKSGDGDAKEQMHFNYAKCNVNKIPLEYKKVLEKYCKIFEKFEYICFDMMKDKNGKIFVIESNSQPGVPFDSTVQIYKKIYEDFYKTQLDEYSLKKLDEYSQTMINKTLEKDNRRFSIKN